MDNHGKLKFCGLVGAQGPGQKNSRLDRNLRVGSSESLIFVQLAGDHEPNAANWAWDHKCRGVGVISNFVSSISYVVENWGLWWDRGPDLANIQVRVGMNRVL